ncbi:MAG: LamG domain-containing protein [Planctomycetes bacterium]|nr:LamG domain-containing protein [Planctomycetota bacterium]MCH8120435.1 LamG domain-containing protein [Planctomycetota bacterium]
MPVLKPVRGIRLNKSHPLARGLVGYWLFNEGSGSTVFDLSGNNQTGTLQADAHFDVGGFGSLIDFDGTGDFVSVVTNKDIGNGSYTVIARVQTGADVTSQTRVILGKRNTANTYPLLFGIDNYTTGKTQVGLHRWDGAASEKALSGIDAVANTDYWVAGTWDGTNLKLYVDGILKGTTDASALGDSSNADDYSIGAREKSGSELYWDGKIYYVYLYNRALTASEIALLYREPFCMFDRAWRPGLIGGQIVELIGTVAGTSYVNGSLGFKELPHEMDNNWLREALFNGMTANAFKLGTSLSLGWFWVRVTGCSVLYRGASMGEIDFTNILAVSGQDEYGGGEISPPSYIPHNNGSTYFYVVRRFNNCGYQERTLAAAVKVSIGSSGELAEPQPNNISGSKADQVANNKVRLTWFYWPCEQGSRPVSFNVYYDDRTGQIDYQNPLATIGYKGRKFYSFQSPDLSGEAGKYLFAIRAEDAGGIENISLARLKIQLDTLNPDAIDILRTEAV